MWEEVQDALRFVPSTPTVAEHVGTVVSNEGRHRVPPPMRSMPAIATPRLPWSWPGLREVVPAALAAGLLLAGAVGLNALPVRTVEHVQEAYNLDYAPVPSASRPR